MLNIYDGDQLLKSIEALSNPYRLKIIEVLNRSRLNVSELARELGISRPLLYLHLQKLEEAGLISGQLEISDDGKAMKYFVINPFQIVLDVNTISEAAETITIAKKRKE